MTEDAAANAAWSELLGVPVDATGPEVCSAFERVLPHILPEMAAWPIYLVPTSSLPAETRDAGKFNGGWCHPTLYTLVQDHLAEDRGYGPTVIVVDERSDESRRAIAASLTRSSSDRYAGESVDSLMARIPLQCDLDLLCRIIVHELAHVLESAVDGDYHLYRVALASQPDLVKKQAGLHEFSNRRESERVEMPPRQQESHGEGFTRAYCHLDARLRSLGAPPTDIGVAGPDFDQLPFSECLAVISDELEVTWEANLLELLAEPMAMTANHN